MLFVLNIDELIIIHIKFKMMELINELTHIINWVVIEFVSFNMNLNITITLKCIHIYRHYMI